MKHLAAVTGQLSTLGPRLEVCFGHAAVSAFRSAMISTTAQGVAVAGVPVACSKGLTQKRPK